MQFRERLIRNDLSHNQGRNSDILKNIRTMLFVGKHFTEKKRLERNSKRKQHWKTAASYREVEARKSRVQELEKLYMDMAMQKELQKKGQKHKLREDEIVWAGRTEAIESREVNV